MATINDLPLTARFEASSLDGQANGSAVTSWVSSAGSVTVTQASGANQPTLVKNAINTNKSAVAFAGSQWLTGTLTSGNTTSWSRTIVARVPNSGGEYQTLTGSSNNYQEGTYIGRDGYGGSSKLRAGLSTTVYGTTTNTIDGNWHVITFTWNVTTQTASMYVDGNLEFSNVVTPSARTSTLFHIGAHKNTPGETLVNGSVAAIFQMDGVYSTEHRSVVHSYVQDTYGIAVSDYEAPVADTTPPTEPTDVTTDVAGIDVQISWTASTDDTAVAGYEVHRGAPGFTPGVGTLIDTEPGTEYLDIDVPDGTYEYKIIAYDGANNKSTPGTSPQTIVNSGSGGTGHAVLFIVGNPTLVSGDQALFSAMVTAGYSVTIRQDSSGNTSVSGFDSVVFSDSADSSYATAYKTAACGVVTLNWNTWDGAEFGLTLPQFALSSSDLGDFKPVYHPISILGSFTQGSTFDSWGGTQVSGRYTTNYNYYDPPAQARVAAMRGNSSSDVLCFTYDAGDRLADGSTLAAGRRVAISLPVGGAAVATANTLNWFTTSVAWASGENPVSDTTPPSAPTSVTASPAGTNVVLTWGASTDATGIGGYEVHRGTSAGFTPDNNSFIDSTTSLGYTDLNVPAGTYYYKIVAYDLDNNMSTPGTSSSVTVTSGSGTGKEVLFIVGNTVLSTGDQALFNRMSAEGYSITVRDDGDANTSTTGIDVILFSETSAASAAANYKNATCGIVVTCWPAWDGPDFNLTVPEFALSTANLGNIVPSAHPIAELAGMVPTVPITSWNSPVTGRFTRNDGYYNAPAEVQIAATIGSAASGDVFCFTYDTGALLADGTTPAPGRRVGLSLLDNAAAVATASALTWFIASLEWASGVDPFDPGIDAFWWNGTTLQPLDILGTRVAGSTVQVQTLTAGNIPDPDPDPDPPTGTLWTLAELQDPTNYGVPAGTTLTDVPVTNINSAPSGTTFQNTRFTATAGTSYDITTSNKTFINCYFQGGINLLPGATDLTFTRCDVARLVVVSGTNNNTFTRLNVRTIVGNDGIHITSDRAGQPQASNLTFDGLRVVGDVSSMVGSSQNHYDCMQVRGINGLTIRNFYMDHGTTFNALFNATVFLENANGGNNNILLDNFYVRAQGYHHLMLFSSNLTVRNGWFPNGMTTNLLWNKGQGQSFTESGHKYVDGTPIPTLFGVPA